MLMPDWLKYDPYANTLSTKEPIPASAGGQTLVVQVSGKDDVILEQFDLHIQNRLEEKLTLTDDVPPPPPVDENEPGVEMQTYVSESSRRVASPSYIIPSFIGLRLSFSTQCKNVHFNQSDQ